MFRKTLIALAAAAAVAGASASTASAKTNINIDFGFGYGAPVYGGYDEGYYDEPDCGWVVVKKKVWNWNHTKKYWVKKKIWTC